MDNHQLYTLTAIGLIMVGLYGALLKRNLIRLALAFSILNAGVHMLIIALGFRAGATAPILNKTELLSDAEALTGNIAMVADPVPQALVLTAIVIGVGVTALMLAYIVRIYANYKTLDIREIRSLKW
ncbi:cation:proton antiporter subunit C [Myxococcota bacterium]|nr:cation:proton antiporter subunit C [Myxococcota bacterium]